jgi:hypothetical protein
VDPERVESIKALMRIWAMDQALIEKGDGSFRQNLRKIVPNYLSTDFDKSIEAIEYFRTVSSYFRFKSIGI